MFDMKMPGMGDIPGFGGSSACEEVGKMDDAQKSARLAGWQYTLL